MVGAHQRGLELFGQGRYEEAIRCFEAYLRESETSQAWNDWAAAQFALGRAREAAEGLRRALQLNPQNTQAIQNIHRLAALTALPQNRSAENHPRVTGQDPVVEEFLRDIQAIPSEDPSFHPRVIRAIRTMRIDSAYFVNKCLERLARLPAEALPKALEALKQMAETDYRLSIVLARPCMQDEDYESALRHLHLACDSSACDLFAENMLIACSRLQAARTGTPWHFEGLKEYLAESFCDMPWRRMEVYEWGFTSLCCLGWLPLCVGDARTQSMDQMWNSDFALEIRKSILDGSFRFCSKIHCRFIAERTLPRRNGAAIVRGKAAPPPACDPATQVNPDEYTVRVPHPPDTLRLCYDRTCNLSCPQCRNDSYAATPEVQARMDQEYLPFMLPALQSIQTVGLNCAGEAFASKHSRRVLSLLKRDQFPRLKILLISNGLLLDERAFRDFDLCGRVSEIQISMDAARPETYGVVRRGGNFQRLLSNLQFLDDLRCAKGENFRLQISFVVSSMNFREMAEFVQLGRKLHVDSIVFSVLKNWAHLSLAEFEKLNVANPGHPDHEEFLRVLESPELSDPIVECGSVAPYRRLEARRDGEGVPLPGFERHEITAQKL